MNKTLITFALLSAVGVAGFVTVSAQDLRHDEQTVLTRWADVHAAERAQLAEVPAVLALADRQPGIDARARASARAQCGLLAQLDTDTTLLDDPQRFDHYKQKRAECTGALFRLLANLRSDPSLAADSHVQALFLSLTQGQSSVDAARQRYGQALVAYNRGVQQLPRGIAAAVLGYQERPDFVRYAGQRG
ncbi:LemA family protein [Roseateles amylovorans]|uniref:LemA family protein n=1 Tax=Roseateles amylovorans TaxID=2978473 RepID=A0ABY6AXK1_9BURK|nr:LemA family protein [Roseateles amylovorans]UXH77906.1 LemA family protein [Roseateles amylovorans]